MGGVHVPKAFVERANCDALISERTALCAASGMRRTHRDRRTPRDIPLGLRYRVVIRDGCQCQLCGRRLPQVETTLTTLSRGHEGGETVLENLRVLCADCNLGKVPGPKSLAERCCSVHVNRTTDH